MFETFLGNEKLKNEMSSLLESSSLPHAIVIYGRKGCGKGYFAKLLAMEYLGDNNGLVLRGEHPDFLEVSGKGVTGTITINSVREAVVESNMAAVMTEGRRVVYIRHAEDLNESSSNALLKAIEEPVNGVVYILTVEHPDKLLATIRSRTSAHKVQPLDAQTCAAELRKRVADCDGKKADELSRVFGGRLGSALDVLTDKDMMSAYVDAREFCDSAMARKRYRAMAASARHIESREDYKAFLSICTQYLGFLVKKNPYDNDDAARVLDAVSEAMETANGINLKLSSTRLAIKSLNN